MVNLAGNGGHSGWQKLVRWLAIRMWFRLGRFWECFDGDAALIASRWKLPPGRRRQGFRLCVGLSLRPRLRALVALAEAAYPSALVDQLPDYMAARGPRTGRVSCAMPSGSVACVSGLRTRRGCRCRATAQGLVFAPYSAKVVV